MSLGLVVEALIAPLILSLSAFMLLIGGLEVGLAHYPFFACLSSQFRLVSSVFGFCYSLTW